MKKANKYIDHTLVKTEYTDLGSFNWIINTTSEDIITVIKQVQKDTIETTLKLASEEAYCDMEHPDEENGLEESETIVIKDSILNLKEQLFKEIDGKKS